MTKKQLKSLKIAKEDISALIAELLKNPEVNVLANSTEFELFRGKIDNCIIILYSTGKVSYHDHPYLKEILSKFEKKVIKQQVVSGKKREKLELRVKLTEQQVNELYKLLEKDSKTKKIPVGNINELGHFVLDNHHLMLYKSGSIYSKTGLYTFKKYIIAAIKAHPPHIEFDLIIGQDEAGKGELFGPLVVASVALTQEQITMLQMLGVKDSKELSIEEIKELAGKIRENSFALRGVVIGAKRFNELHKTMRDEGKTLNDLLAWGHAKALENILNELKGEEKNKKILLIIDEFDRVKTDERLKKVLTPNIKVIQRIKAENLSISVAAASIIAKEIRDKELEKLSKLVEMPISIETLDDLLLEPNANEIIRYGYLKNAMERGTIFLKSEVKGKEADVFISQVCSKGNLESHRLDFKKDFPKNADNIGKLISAFANNEGGEIYFGIDDKTHEIIGIENPQKLEERISGQRIKCLPPPAIKYTTYILSNNKIVLRAYVYRSNELVQFEGRYYIRDKNSSITRTMTPEEIKNRFYNQ